MEKSTSAENHTHDTPDVTVLFMFSVGLSFFWACFFTMLMRNSFLDGDIEMLWYHLAIRIAFLTCIAVAGMAIFLQSDRVATEKGHRILFGAACLFPVIAAASSLTAFSVGSALPLIFDIFAWGFAGIALTCMLSLWIDMLSAFENPFIFRCLTLSVCVGGVSYWVINSLPFPLNISLLCISAVASLIIFKLLEAKGELVYPAFVSLEESKSHAKPSAAHIGVLMVYGIVFGLGIGSTTQLEGDILLYGSIAAFLILGALFAFLFLRHFSGNVRQNEILRIMFPVLVIALIPMSFLEGIAYAVCNLLLLSSFICLEIIDLNSQLQLSRKQKASVFYTFAISQVPLFIGLMIGHVVGLLASITGVANYSMLSAVALGLVVILAIFITFAPFNPIATHKKHEEESESPNQGKWRNRCAAVAQEYSLSARETEVFLLLAKGRGIEHIQNKLFISGHTVKTHTYNIYRKMDINSREELLDIIEQGFLVK